MRHALQTAGVQRADNDRRRAPKKRTVSDDGSRVAVDGSVVAGHRSGASDQNSCWQMDGQDASTYCRYRVIPRSYPHSYPHACPQLVTFYLVRNKPTVLVGSAATSKPLQTQRTVRCGLYQSKLSRRPQKNRKSPFSGDSRRFLGSEKCL